MTFRSDIDASDAECDSPILPAEDHPHGLQELIRDVLVLGSAEYSLHKFFRSA